MNSDPPFRSSSGTFPKLAASRRRTQWTHPTACRSIYNARYRRVMQTLSQSRHGCKDDEDKAPSLRGNHVMSVEKSPVPPPAPPPPIPHGVPITLELAKRVADAAEAEARKQGW